jgi:tetratricopeptide (TPR) repeat protein
MSEEAAVSDPRAFKQLEEKLYADKKWAELVEAYAARAARLEDPDHRERLLFQAGTTAEQKLQDPAAAAGYYRRAFDVRKTFVRALGALRALQADKKDLKAVAETLELELAATPEPTKKARLQKELGDALAGQEGLDPEESIKAYTRALELDPKQRGALVELEKICRKHAKWNKLVAAYKKLADTTFGKDSAVFHFFAGTMLDEKLKQYDYASRAFKQSLEAKPEDARIYGTIASFFEKRKAWDDCLAALEAQVPLCDGPKEKAKALRKMAGIAEKGQNDPAAAVKLYKRAIAERPDDAEALGRLRAIAEAKNDDIGVAEVLELEAQNLELATDEKADRFEKAAERREKAGDAQSACGDLYKVIELKPRSPRALKSLERLTKKLARWPEHARALELEAALLDPSRSPEEKTATLSIERRLAEVREKFLQDPKGALASLSRILTIDPDDKDALERVESLARKQKDWPRVAQALQRRLEKTKEEPARARIATELATVREDQLDDSKGAAEAWEEALARDRTLTDRGLAALRRLYEKQKDWVGLSRTLTRLVEAAQATNRPVSWRAQLLRDQGACELARGEPLPAAKALREAIALEPESEGTTEARRKLVDADRAHGKGDALRGSLTELAARDPDPAVARSARLELAKLEEKDQRPAEAIKVLEDQLALTPADEEALPHVGRLLAALGHPLEAVEKLEVASRSVESEDPLKAAGFAREAARILEKEATHSPDPTDGPSFLLRAKQSWGRVLELNPEDDTAAERFADLCRKTNDSAGLEAVLERACGRAADPQARARLNKERASLARGPLQNPTNAVSLYERVLKDSPNDADATVALLELYRSLSRWNDLCDLLEATAARDQTTPQTRPTDRLALKKLDKPSSTVPDANSALREAAEVAATKLQDLERAVSCLDRLVERSPDDDSALAVLAGHLETLKRPRDLERVLEKRATLAPVAGIRADLLLQRATLLERELQDAAAASKAYEKCLESRANDRKALEGLARVRGQLGNVKGAVEALARAAEAALAAGDALGAANLELQRGDMARGHRDLPAAEAAYRAAIARIPSLDRAHDSLAELLTERADWTALAKALDEAATNSQKKRRADLLVRRADTLTLRLERGEEALAALELAEQAAPDTPSVLDARARAHRRLGRLAALADTLAARRALEVKLNPPQAAPKAAPAPPSDPRKKPSERAPAASGAAEAVKKPGEPKAAAAKGVVDARIPLLREEAHIRAFSLGELARARELLDEARAIAPRDALVVADLLRIERRAGTLILETKAEAESPEAKARGQAASTDRLIELLTRAAELEANPKKKADLLVEAGRVAKVRKADPAKAEAFFEAALAADATRIEAMRWLQGLARDGDDMDELALWLEREAQIESDPRRRALVHARLGDCHRRRGKPDAARKSYEQALVDDTNHAPALRHLAPLLRRAKEWPKLAALLERLAKLEPDKHARRERLVMLGEVRSKRLGDPKAARAAFDEALALEADDLDALRGRAKTLDPKTEAKELVETLAKELRLTPSASVRADLHKRIGELRFDALNDLENAAKAFGAAIRIRPDDEGARSSLRQVYMASKDWSKLARSYEDEARRSTDSKVKEERFRQAALVRHHHLHEIDKAIVLYKEILALGDPHVIAIEVLPTLLEGRGDERLEVIARIPDIVPGTRAADDALLELGKIREERGDRAAAEVLYERLLKSSPGNPRALDALVALHRTAKDLPRLADALGRKIATLDKKERALARLHRGAVLEEILDLDAAALEYEGAALDDPHSLEAIAHLRAVYARRERWPELAKALALAFDRTKDDSAAVKIALEKATVEEARLRDPRAALATLRRAAQRAAGAAGTPAAKEGIALAVADRTVEILSKVDMPDELAQALEVKAGLVPAGAARARVLAEAARVYDAELGRAEAAIDAWGRCLDQTPDDRAALASLQELCARSNDRRGRARALEREMDLVLSADQAAKLPAKSSRRLSSDEESERLVACALEAAKIHEELGDPDAASRALERALDRDADSKPVFEELARIYETRGHDVTLYDLLKRRARASSDRREQADLRERMAKLAETLGDDEGAIADWEELLVRRPKERKGLVALKRLRSGREEWAQAAEVSEREIAVVSEIGARQGTASGDSSAEGFALPPLPELPALHLALGELYEKRLAKPTEAVNHYQLAHARDAHDPRPLRGIERLKAKDEDWEAVSRARASLRDLEEDPAKRASLALGIASAEERLGHRADAIAALRGALEDVPDNAVALALLRGHLLELKRWEEASGILAREADVARERGTQIARRLERAKLQREHLSDDKGAIQELELVRALDHSNLEALRGLEELYERAQDRFALASVLDDQARVEADNEHAADLLAHEGEVLAAPQPEGRSEEPKEQSERLALAAAAYERALLRASERPAVLDALVAIWEATDRPLELARVIHRRAELAANAAERATLLRRAAEIEERSLEDPEQAARTLEELTSSAAAGATESEKLTGKAATLTWDLDAALAELARLRGALGAHAARELALRKRTELARTDEARRTLLLERARVLEEHLGRPQAAAECVQEVLGLFQDDAALADELARLREAGGDPVGVVKALDHALALAERVPATGENVERLRSLHRKRGELCASVAYDPEKGLGSFRCLLEMDPDDDLAREALETLLSREGRARELAEHLAGEVARRTGKGAEPKSLAGLERRRAELLRGPLADPAQAEVAFRAALELDPDDARSREGLEALLRAEGKQEALAALLAENAHRATNDVVAAEALREEAQVHEQRGDNKTAIDRLESARKRAPEDRRTLRALVRLYRLEDKSEALAVILSELVKALATQPPAERAQVLVERGLVLSRELGRQEEAEQALEEALRLDNKSVPAARAYAPLLEAREAFPELVKVYELEAGSGVDRPRRVWLRAEMGRLRRDRLGDQEGAARAFQEALALDAGSVAALLGLSSVLRARGRHGELAGPLERLADVSPSPEDRRNAKRELAHLLEEKLDEPSKAAERYKQILAEEGRDKDAVQGLERCLRTLMALNAATPDSAPAAKDKARNASQLKNLLVEAVERELALSHGRTGGGATGSEDVAHRFALLVEAASLHEGLAEENTEHRKRHLEATALTAREACELKPQDTEALATYARVAEKLGRWKELADATERLAGVVDDKTRAAWMHRRVGKLRAHRLGDAEGAAASFEAAARIDPRDREAFEALEPLARDLKDPARLLAALRGQLALAQDDARRATVALRLGEAFEQAQDLSRAIEAYVLAREKGKSPQRKDAQKALDRCYRATERWTDLARILEARVLAEPESAAALLLERARVCEERLARYDKAAEALREALKIAPDEAGAIKSLEAILIHTEKWDELADLYESESGRRGARGYEVLVKLGKLYRDKLDEAERAASSLQRAATINPSGLEAIEALRDLYTKIERWPELLEVLRLEIGLVKEPRGREARLLRAARIAEEKLGDLAQAARFYQEASQISPNDRAHLAALARVQEARGDEEGLVRTLERDLALTRDPPEIVLIRKKIGLCYAKRLFRRTDAVASYREALAVDPDDDEALVALADLHRESESWADLAIVLDRRAARARGRDALAIRLELARVLAGKLNRAEEALKMAAAARSVDPRSPDAIAIEVEVLRGLGRQDELAEALARLAGTKTDPKERAAVLVELAVQLETELRRPERALRALEEALTHDPVNEAAIARATALQEKQGRWDDLLETFERSYKLAPLPAQRATLRARSGAILEERKKDAAGAERHYRDAIANDPAQLAAISGLARVLHGREAKWSQRAGGSDKKMAAELAALEEKRAELERDPLERARALARAGTVYADGLEDFDTAKERYTAALQTAPDLFDALAPLAELHYGREELDKARPLLERVAVSPDLNADAERAADLLHALAMCREHARDREGAAAALKAALEHKASHAQVLEDLARLLCEDGAFAAAVPILEDLVGRTRIPSVRAMHELSLARALAKTGKPDRALDLFRRGLEKQPDDHRSREAHAALLVERNDLDGARREFERLTGVADQSIAAKARIGLADLFEGPLQNLEAAAKHLAVAVEIPGDHAGRAARRLAELHARAERWQEAATLLAKAIELEPAPEPKAELYAKLGRLFRDRIRKVELARRCLEKSVELVHDRHTVDSLARLLEAANDWDALEQLYGRSADHAREKRLGDQAQLRMKRAEVLWRKLKKPKAAAKEFEAVLSLEPGHTGARAALAQIYVETKDVRGVERIYRELLHEDPLVVDHYRALASAWKDAGAKDAYHQGVQPIIVLAAANDEEKAARGGREGKTSRGLRAEDWPKLIPADARGPVLDLLTGLAEVFERSIPEDLKSYGLGMLKRSLPLEGDGFPEHRLVKRVADLMGVGDSELDLYWMSDWKRPEAILAHAKKGSALILCPATFAGLAETEKAFVIARAIALVPARLEFAHAVPARDLERYILAAAKAVDMTNSFSFSGEDDKETRAFIVKVGKAVTPELAERLKPAAIEIGRRRGKLDMEGFRRAAVLTASRAGVLAAGGAHAAVLAIVKTNVALRGRIPPTTAEVIREFREVAELKDILEFSVSEGYLETRKALGLARD